MGRQRVRVENMENSLEKLDLEEKKGVGGAVVRRKHFLSSFNGRTSLSLFKYWWEEARRERDNKDTTRGGSERSRRSGSPSGGMHSMREEGHPTRYNKVTRKE